MCVNCHPNRPLDGLHYLFAGLPRSSESLPCCSGVNLFLIRTSSVTCSLLISRSAASTFSNCAIACCSSTCGCLASVTSFSISSCSFHCNSVNFNCACRISDLKYSFCSALRPIASWCWITISGAKKLCPMGSWSGCCALAAPAANRKAAQIQKSLFLISFLRFHGDFQIRLAEFRCPLQNLLPRRHQQ